MQGGTVVEIGPGVPLSPPTDQEEELWKAAPASSSPSSLQARIGDYALFLRKGAIELKLDGDSFLIVPQSALLVLIRDRE